MASSQESSEESSKGSSPKLEFRVFVINKPPGESQDIFYKNGKRLEVINEASTSGIHKKELKASNENVLKTNSELKSFDSTDDNNTSDTSDDSYHEESVNKSISDTSDDSYNEERVVKRNKTFIKHPRKENSYESISGSNDDDKENKGLGSRVKDNKKKLSDIKRQRRYPKRTKKIVNYYEGYDDYDDDCYIFCDICGEEFYDGCKLHPLKNISDTVVSTRPRNMFRARLTIPFKYLRIGESTIPSAGEGVLSNVRMSMGLRFGPYEGTSKDVNNGGYYSWQIRKNGKMVSLVDGYDESKANWMRFVNCARTEEEQNVMAFVYRGNIFYRTVKPIPKNTELLVYYGNNYAKELKINTKNFHYLCRRS